MTNTTPETATPEKRGYTVQWEDGVRMSHPVAVPSRNVAFATLDAWMRDAEYPASLRVVIAHNGRTVWSQLGTHIETNA